MNISSPRTLSKTLIAMAVATALLTACATAPMKPEGAAAVRNKLVQLQSNPQLADRASIAMKDAEMAVRAAETPQTDEALARHLVFIADRKVDTAKALAETALAEDQRTALNQQREKARLDSRSREVDVAKNQAAVARADSDQSRADADAARAAATSSQQQSAELQRQIDEMHAKVTDRGVVLTLGDVLFTSGQADLKTAATGNLNKLVTFLNTYPNRTVVVEGYTDSVGSDDYNQGLSERRADGVKSYLVRRGVGSERLTALGKGKADPVAGNDSADGRQQNRRVEVVISNPAAAAR
ncbi:MAG TPA: OmpA family protein [Steroidobacteraceae bacterium]|nr:OmpA family protein [Steroidobacteraceae bacterium]